jgi:hypothetical protein
MTKIWPDDDADDVRLRELAEVFVETEGPIRDAYGLVRVEHGILYFSVFSDGRHSVDVLRDDHPEEYARLLARVKARDRDRHGGLVFFPEMGAPPMPPFEVVAAHEVRAAVAPPGNVSAPAKRAPQKDDAIRRLRALLGRDEKSTLR